MLIPKFAFQKAPKFWKMKRNRKYLFLLLALVIVFQVSTAQDNRKGIWLPDSNIKNRDKTIEQVNDFLKTLQGSLSPMVISLGRLADLWILMSC